VRVSEAERILPGKFYNPRISYDGKYWYISVGRDVEPEQEKLTPESIGLTFSVDNLFYASNDMHSPNFMNTPTITKLSKKIARLKRTTKRRYTMNQVSDPNPEAKSIHSHNMRKAQNQLILAQRRLNNIKLNHIHQATTALVKTKPNRIVMQSPQTKSLDKDMVLSKSISEQGIYNFKRILEYKCKSAGVQFIASMEPLSTHTDTCYLCGHSERQPGNVFHCPSCKESVSKDYQAASNLAISNW